MTAIDLLSKARQLEVGVVQYGPNLALYQLPECELRDVLAAAREWNIEIEVGTRGIETDHLLRMLDFTRDCGSVLLRTIPEVEGGRVPSRDEMIALLRTIEPRCQSAGVRLGLENGLIPAADLRSALEAVSSDFVGITLDTVNSLAIPEGTREVAQTLAPWTRCLHVKDFIVRREWHMMGFRVEGRPAGQGQLDVPWLLALLANAGARANPNLELWPPEQNTLEETIALEQRWAEESIHYLRGLIGE
jgi:sugar phosphate isomerase/epimerase